MKKILFMCMAACVFTNGFTQEEKKEETQKNDTIRVGGMIIIKKAGSNDHEHHSNDTEVKIYKHKNKPENITTNWCVFDFGFAAYNDKTKYTSLEAQAFAPGSNEDWFDLNSGKSVNVNFWLFMQRVNMIKHVVNLKYGFGFDLNNYHFDDERVQIHKNPTYVSLNDTLKGAKKNKLAADYITVPMMINFNFTPDRNNGFGLSAGISAGYLYNARQKVKMGDEKTKVHNDFDLERWKISYVGELLLGPIKFYGTYALNSMWEKGLDHTPYSVGIRFSY